MLEQQRQDPRVAHADAREDRGQAGPKVIAVDRGVDLQGGFQDGGTQRWKRLHQPVVEDVEHVGRCEHSQHRPNRFGGAKLSQEQGCVSRSPAASRRILARQIIVHEDLHQRWNRVCAERDLEGSL